MAQSREYPDLTFLAPKSWTPGRRPGCPKLIVIHYTAGTEGPASAEAGASYDQRRTDGTSTHYHVDSDSVIQCVYTWNEAHAARTRGNDVGIQYELAGTRQTRQQWLDAVSEATLTNAARQAARDAVKYGIPVRQLSPAQVRAAHPDFGDQPIKGFCGHADVTLAFPEDAGDHLDPGGEFPWDVFLDRVRRFMEGGMTMGQQVLIRANDDTQVWLADGMFRRRIPAAAIPGVSNAQTHQAGFLGPLGNGGNVYTTGPAATLDVWGVDVETLAVEPAPVDVATLTAALQDPAVRGVLVATAEEGANRAEDE